MKDIDPVRIFVIVTLMIGAVMFLGGIAFIIVQAHNAWVGC